MSTVITNKNNILPLLSGFNILQPWRHQPIVIEVPYEAYRDFVRNMTSCGVSLLRFRCQDYIRALNDENLMVKFYYVDLSNAIANEVKMAHIRDTYATTLLPSFEEHSVNLSYSDIPKEVLTFPEEVFLGSMNDIRNDVAMRYRLTDLSEHNRQIYQVAYLLRCNAKSRNATRYNIQKEEYGNG